MPPHTQGGQLLQELNVIKCLRRVTLQNEKKDSEGEATIWVPHPVGFFVVLTWCSLSWCLDISSSVAFSVAGVSHWSESKERRFLVLLIIHFFHDGNDGFASFRSCFFTFEVSKGNTKTISEHI